MYRLYYKTKKNLNNKGFTLVELLAVIVVLAIIMLIAIPAILDSLDNAKRKSFETYTYRILTLADQETMKREIDGNSFGEQCYVYNITKDFELNNTGDYEGYVLLQVSADTKKYYVTMWSNDYMLISYNITDSKDYYGKKKSIQDSLERYDSSREDELSIQSLCNYACNSCTYEKDGSKETVTGDPTKIKGATTLLKGSDLKSKLWALVGDQHIVNIKRSYELPSEDVTKDTISITWEESSKDNPVYAWFDTDTIYFYSDATQIFLNRDCQDLFSWYSNLKDITDFVNSTKTNKVENASYLFYKNTGIENLDLSNWTFDNARNFFAIFNGCESLETLNVSTWKPVNVRDMRNIFTNCKKLKTLDLNNWDTSNVTDIRNAFSSCTSLETLNISNWNVSNVSLSGSVFENCSSLKELDLNNWKTSKFNSLAGMFSGCKSLTVLKIKNWDTRNVVKLGSAFMTTSSLKELDLSDWNVEKVDNMGAAFKDCHAKIIVKNWNTKSLTNMNGTFWGTWCDLDLSSFDTSNVTNMNGLFHFTGASVIDISSWDTSKVTGMGRMFANSSCRHVYVGPKWTVDALSETSWEMFMGA